jgi:hypothetical protein
MNRRERRRQAAIAKQNKFVADYVRHLPEVGPEVLGQPGVTHMVCFHDEGCRIYSGEGCNCEPDVRFYAGPMRT